ncbi:hypothetical protein FHP25_08685 [Vineibacter terrae]|uniref:Uncharacterized protein n=1 Tax=Vineibacter terrae TaxID=2586908 RepID=A0A5C8PRY7_9HYPH|nr:hypothetical protein [Vineibacter terrae]TXL78254.1 hypothetical protein FHP25_08685 [Vineibacter terrae]
MARHFSIPSFFRQVPNALLRRCFVAHGLLVDFDFEAMPETRPNKLLEAWRTLPDAVRNEMEAEFTEVFDMACEKGARAILDEAQWQMRASPDSYKAFADKLASMPGHFERAVSVFLDHRDLWRGAALFYHADTLPYWRKRPGLPRVSAAIECDSRRELALGIGTWFHEVEGRGRSCMVELLRRDDRDYFFVYPEDYSQQSIEWVDGQFSRRPHNPAFEIVYVWSQHEGTLDFNHRGARKAVEPLQRIFARAILKLDDLPPETKHQRVYDLNPLRSRGFQFVYTPDGGILRVAVRKLRLSSRIRSGDSMTFEADIAANPLALYDLLEEVERSIPLTGQWNVTQAEISVLMLTASDKPPKTVTFQISWPNSCSLKYDAIGLKLRAMLKASGIEPR